MAAAWPYMKAFLVVAGIVFGLVVGAHIVRMVVEPRMAADPWFWALTAAAAALSVWAWVLAWRTRRM
jgi:hypothetical protein